MKVLLHICCGVCAAGAAEKLMSEGHELTGYYFNPNIYPVEEYNQRLKAAEIVADIMKFPLIVSPYSPEKWLENTASLSQEPEGGKRCEICFRIRLQATYEYMRISAFDAFTTTLTIGPQKSAAAVNRIGREIGGDKFLIKDLKKQGGFQRANQLAKQLSIYRQNYCGCKYSIRNPDFD
jgi:predicted adenine nucleotide alpha hydrolase (AANH) superfamily ATPase